MVRIIALHFEVNLNFCEVKLHKSSNNEKKKNKREREVGFFCSIYVSINLVSQIVGKFHFWPLYLIMFGRDPLLKTTP